MDVHKVFHMTGGAGDTSYAKNSSLQKKASDMVKCIIMETLQDLYLETSPTAKSLVIADLGCSSGPNSLSIVRDMIHAVAGASRKISAPAPEIRVYLNDLPTNDFNSVFKALPEFYREVAESDGGRQYCPSVFVAGYPGSFYGRLFPGDCLHFVYSSYSLHWLSRIPAGLYGEQGKSINKGSVYISENSPPEVSQAYQRQFRRDFSLFLRCRSEEVVEGGRMVLILLGRAGPHHLDRGNAFFWNLLTRSFSILVSQGEVEEEKLDSYDVHFYAASQEEIEDEVRREGSFEIDRLETFEIEKEDSSKNDGTSYGTAVAMTVRAIQQSMISHHFGEHILDALFDKYGRLVDEEMAKEDIRPITFLVVLRKLAT
ncbi:probable methyltransferase TCM_000336 [Malania oleifera]|uniref:probable methyltransferase TCM_000336 n=1 Tax=Malania oleifera TaxID=397392 RepID=UPI0025AE0096|nr:probable methyltransferase TCM_000336 [Malania oleifera]